MFGRLKAKALHHYRKYMSAIASSNALHKISELRYLRAELAARQPSNMALAGYKVYSQNDEDGIIAAIFERIGGNRTFLEIGLQDGTECNTLYLLMQGWRGGWVESDPNYCGTIRKALQTDAVPGAFKLVENFAGTDNIATLYRDICVWVGEPDLAFLSLDIDGNDLHVLQALLKAGCRPTVICIEYNGKFPTPIRASVVLDETRVWAKDDYFGASLQSFVDLLGLFDYGLVTCSLFGANAFFIQKEQAGDIQLHPPENVWQPLRLHLTPYPAVHIPSIKFARDALSQYRAPSS